MIGQALTLLKERRLGRPPEVACHFLSKMRKGSKALTYVLKQEHKADETQ